MRLGGLITAMNMVNPAGMLVAELLTQGGQKIPNSEFESLIASVKLVQLHETTHGELIPHPTENGRTYYEYRSKPGYVGKDQAVFMTEFLDKRFKIVSEIVVSMYINENDPQCPDSQLIHNNLKK